MTRSPKGAQICRFVGRIEEMEADWRFGGGGLRGEEDLVGGEGEAEVEEWRRDPLGGVKKVVYLSILG
jgi:hypothetical protein